MHYARQGAPTPDEADQQAPAQVEMPAEAGEGYAGVALGIIEALETGEPLYTALNVPNAGAITGMAPGDVVEVSCRVDAGGIQTLPVGEAPAPQLDLMQAVKDYERLTVEAVRTRSRRAAVEALMAHPLVGAHPLMGAHPRMGAASRARDLVDKYLAAHAAYVGEWSEA
jgi:6-phospho-beta-glucosidase